MKEHTQEPDRGKVASSSKSLPEWHEEINRTREESSVTEEAINLSTNLLNGAVFIYTADERSGIDENRRKKRHRQMTENDRKTCGEQSKQKKHGESSDSHERCFDDDRNGKADRKKM